MRRSTVLMPLIMIMLAISACGNGNDDNQSAAEPTAGIIQQPTSSGLSQGTTEQNGTSGSRPDSGAPTLPPPKTIDPLAQLSATPTATATGGGLTTRPDLGGPTLPPPQTLSVVTQTTPDADSTASQDANSQNGSNPDNTSNSSGNNGGSNGSNGGSSGSNPPNSGNPTSRPDSGAPTLPPPITRTVVVLPTQIPPSATPTVPQVTLPPQELPPYCSTFVGDVEKNAVNYNILLGNSVKIYWFPINTSGYSYLVQLLDEDGFQLENSFVDAAPYEYEFGADLFGTAGTYYWKITPYKLVNGQPSQPGDCPPLDDEIFIRRQ